MKRLQNCDSCHDCDEDCCCSEVGFEACIEEVNECRVLGKLGFGWATPPACILARAAGRLLRYSVHLRDCENDADERVFTNVTEARDCAEEAYRFTRREWAGGGAVPFGECVPELCLTIYASGGGDAGLEVLARCYACPDACEECPSSSVPESPGSPGAPSSSDVGGSSSSSLGEDCACSVSMHANAFGPCIPVELGGTGTATIFYTSSVDFDGCNSAPAGTFGAMAGEDSNSGSSGSFLVECEPGDTVDVTITWTANPPSTVTCSATKKVRL